MGPPGEAQAFPAELLEPYLAAGDKAGVSGGQGGAGRRRRSIPDFQNEMAQVVQTIGEKKIELGEGVTMVVRRLFNQIDSLRSEVKKIRYPTGEKDSPAPSCRDIKMLYDTAEDGNYHLKTMFGYFKYMY